MVRALWVAIGVMGGNLVCAFDAVAAEAASDTNHPPATEVAVPVTAATEREFVDAYENYQKLSAAGKREEALPYARRAYELGLAIYGADHQNTAALALNLGETLEKTGHRREAVQMLDTAIDLFQRIYGQEARDLIDPLMARGHAAGPWDAKEQTYYFDRAIEVGRNYVKADDLLLARLNLEAGIHVLRNGNTDAAKRYLQDAYNAYDKQLAATDTRVVLASFWLGKYHLATRKPRAAEPLFERVLTALEVPGAPNNPLVEASHALLVVAYEQLGDPARATPHCVAIGQLVPWDASAAPLYLTAPDYPADAKGREGYALIEFTVDASGFVRDPKLLTTQGSDAFGEAGLVAIRTWRYAPRFMDGAAVDTPGVQAKVDFKLTL